MTPIPDTADRYWTRQTDGATRLGLRPHVVEAFAGDWVALELPKPGAAFLPGDTFGFVTTSLSVYDLRAPMAFRVAAINEAAETNPRLVSLSPTGAGWLLEIETIGPVARV